MPTFNFLQSKESIRALARADLLPAGEKNRFSGKESEHVSRSAANKGFDVSLRCLEYRPNHFCLTLPETQYAGLDWVAEVTPLMCVSLQVSCPPGGG